MYGSIAKCNKENDLEVIFDESSSFDVCIQSCINKANKMTGIIKKNIYFLR